MELMMKNTSFLTWVFVLFFPGIAHAVSASDSFYECWTHPGGKPDKVARVWAKSTARAVAKATEEFRLMDIKPIGVKCKTKQYRRVKI
jgi:hypothetical protein